MNIKATISRKPWILAILVFALTAIWMGTGLRTDHEIKTDTSQIKAAGDAGGVLRVQVQTMYAEPITRFISVYGRTAPARTVNLSSETEGRVIKINSRRGVPVKKGTALLELDMRDRQASVEQSRASVREHETAYNAQLQLKADGYVSDTQLAETLAKLESAKAELIRARLDLDNRVVKAPFDGVLQERDVEIGDFVRSGDALATFVDNLTLIVTGTLAEQEIANIDIGEEAKAKLVTGQMVKGYVRYLSPVADESTRTFKVELEIDNSDGQLPAGVTAEMILEGGNAMAQKISPALLTLDSAGTLGIYVVDELQRAAFMPITIERSDSDGIWVSGLPEAANVITVGQGYVNPGQLVDPVRAPTETAVAAESLR
jgi:multidrug efflux system membrane fusion protein